MTDEPAKLSEAGAHLHFYISGVLFGLGATEGQQERILGTLDVLIECVQNDVSAEDIERTLEARSY